MASPPYVQTPTPQAFVSSASPRTVSFTGATTIGNTVVVTVSSAGNKLATFTVTDNKGNNYIFGSRRDDNASHVIAQYFASDISGGASHSVIVTPSVAVAMTITPTELGASGQDIIPDVMQAGAIADTGLTIELTPNHQVTIVGGVTHSGAGTVTISPDTGDFSYLVQAGELENTTAPLNVLYGVNLNPEDSPVAAWLFDDGNTTVTAIGVALAFYLGDAIQAPEPDGPTPDLMYDLHDPLASFTNAATLLLREHFGGAVAQATGDAMTLASDNLAITNGSILLPETGQLGTVVLAIKVAGNIISANDAGNSANGAFFAKYASNATSGSVRSDAGGTDGNIATASGVGEATQKWTVSISKTTDGRARLGINGAFYYANISGNALAATVVRIFALYANGTPAAGTGTLYRCQVYNSCLSENEDRTVQEDMIGYSLEKPTRRFQHFAFNNATQKMILGSSNNGTSFQDYVPIAFTPAGGGIIRDVSTLYDADLDPLNYYLVFTTFIDGTRKFEIAKALVSDPRKVSHHATIDLSGSLSGGVSPVGLAWFTDVDDALYILFNHLLDGSHVRILPVSDLVAGTVGTLDSLVGASGSDPEILLPSQKGNPIANKYRFLGGAPPHHQDSTLLLGTYGSSTTTLAQNSHEAVQVLALDPANTVIQYSFGDLGGVYQLSTDNGATWSAASSVAGWNIATGGDFDVGQGDVLDLKPLGLWSAPTNPGAAALLLGIL